MYEQFSRGKVGSREDCPEAVTDRHDTTNAFLSRHERDSRRALADGLCGVRSRARHLLARIGDTRALRLAWDDLACRGGASPGPNGLRYTDLADLEVWDLCRSLGRAIQSGTYRPGPERVVHVDKGGGRGTRPIALLNIEDRVVQRALVLILQPLLDPLLDDRSFGFRPHRGHLRALALAEHLTLTERRRIWVTDDITDAFAHVPITRLLQVVNKLLPARDLLDLLERILPGQSGPGLRQGGSLSPLMLNVYLNHVLDRPWRRDNPDRPLIRMADDLLVLCRGPRQAREAHAALGELLLPAGLSLKETAASAMHDLGDDGVADWLGFAVHRVPGGLAYGITPRAWARLETYLALAHTKADAPLRAIRTIKQWLGQRGPVYQAADREQVCARIIAAARRQAFEEVPGPRALDQLWQRAHTRWLRLLAEVGTSADPK